MGMAGDMRGLVPLVYTGVNAYGRSAQGRRFLGCLGTFYTWTWASPHQECECLVIALPFLFYYTLLSFGGSTGFLVSVGVLAFFNRLLLPDPSFHFIT
jgi:hypothetical protein